MSKKVDKAILDEDEALEEEKKVELERKQYIEDLKRILSTNEGKRFFNKFFSDSMIFVTTFTGNSETFFKEGKRSVGLRLFGDIMEARPDMLLQLAIKKERYYDD